MKRVYKEDFKEDFNDEIFGMANLTTKRTGLPVVIWSQHDGVEYNKSDKIPRVKLYLDSNTNMSISIEEKPKILAQSSNIKKSDMKKFNPAIDYVGRNYDLFLKHYNDTTEDFDDTDLFNALKERGEYR